MASVHFYGDSITYGIGDPEGGGFASRIRSTMMERMMNPVEGRRAVIVHNLARLAMTLPQIVEGLPANLASRDGRGRLIVATMVGFSDSIAPAADLPPNVPLAIFRNSLTEFTSICNDADYPVHRVFIQSPPVNLDKSHPDNPGDISPARIAEYQAAVEAHALDTQAVFIRTHDTLQALGQDPHSKDGIHLNKLGHEALRNLVLPAIDGLL